VADIDLEKPGKLLGSGLNAKDYTFLIMKDQPQYTAQAIGANPGCVDASDLLLTSPVIPDAGGNASFDIAASAVNLKKLMTGPVLAIKVAVVGTSKATNADPLKRLADVQSFQLLKGTPTLALGAQTTTVPVGASTIVAVQFQYLDTVTLTMSPPDVFQLSKTSLVKSDTLTATPLKDGTATITASGTGSDGNLTQTLDLTALGMSVTLPGIGFKDPT